MSFMPLLKELGRASRVGVTINMALLAELGTSPSLKIRIRCRALSHFSLQNLAEISGRVVGAIASWSAAGSGAPRRFEAENRNGKPRMTRMKSDFSTGLSGPILTAPHERNAVLIRGIREIRGSGANCRTCREEAQNTQKVVKWGFFLGLLRLFAATSAFCDHLSSIGIWVELSWGRPAQ